MKRIKKFVLLKLVVPPLDWLEWRVGNIARCIGDLAEKAFDAAF